MDKSQMERQPRVLPFYHCRCRMYVWALVIYSIGADILHKDKEERAKESLGESSQRGVWGRGGTLLLLVLNSKLAKFTRRLRWTPLISGRKRKGWKQSSVSVGCFNSQEGGIGNEYLPSSSAVALAVAVPKCEHSCDDVTTLLMVHALVDTLHCPKICNHLIVIAILLYCHYGTSGGESYEHVISAERDNLLNLTKCHHFSKMNQNYFYYVCLTLIFCSDNDWEPLIILKVGILPEMSSLLQ